MQLIVPYLFPSARLIETAAQDLRLPAFETLLARGRRDVCAAEGVEAQVCGGLGIARQQDYPIAPITLQSEGGDADKHYWLRADPVHLRVMRDRIVLASPDELRLTQPEAEALAHSIGEHFGPAFSPQTLHPARWYQRLEQPPRLHTTPISLAVGCDIDPLLPQGEDAMLFRTQLNELQMLLFDHPVNQAREARGELPVSSLWLWGGGCLPAVPKPAISKTAVTLYSNDVEERALARFCGVEAETMPEHFSARLLEENSLIVLDQLTEAGQYGDALGWREAISALERDWFAPLLAHLHWHPSTMLHVDPVIGKSLSVNTADTWKFWRQPTCLSLSKY